MLKMLFIIFNAAKFGKILTTGGTMIISVFAYALLFGWRYAAGFVLLIFVHEMGHYLAARQMGLDVGAPTFIPFVGAWIELKDQPMSAQVESYIALAGPVLGSVGALACYFAALNTQSALLMALAYAGFMLNLWNLIPLHPLDGGRIVSVLSPKIWLFGLPLLLGLFFVRPSPMLIIILLLAIPSLISLWKGTWRDHLPEGYFDQPAQVKWKYGSAYLGLAAFLAIMSHEVHQGLSVMLKA